MIVMPTCQEIQHTVTKEKEKINLTDNMPEHGISYSMARLEENIQTKTQVLVPQSLLNNPITDPEYSERVKSFMLSEKKADIYEIRIKQPVCVGNDLLSRAPLRQTQFTKPHNDHRDAKERLGVEASQKDAVQNISGGQLKIGIMNAGSTKRKFEGKTEEYAMPACKTSKVLNSAISYQFHSESNLMKKIHSDCLLALKQDVHGNYPLHNAVLQSNLKLISRFSSVLTALNKSLDLPNFQGMSALLLAVDLRQSSAVSYLVRLGAEPAVATSDGNTSYHLAVKRRDSKSLRELMKRRLNREDIDLLNDQGLTPLHLAVLARDEILVKMLLAFGARPDSQNAITGKTATLLATELGCLGILHMLESSGSGISIASTSYSGVVPTAIYQEERFANMNQLAFHRDLLEHFYSQI